MIPEREFFIPYRYTIEYPSMCTGGRFHIAHDITGSRFSANMKVPGCCNNHDSEGSSFPTNTLTEIVHSSPLRYIYSANSPIAKCYTKFQVLCKCHREG